MRVILPTIFGLVLLRGCVAYAECGPQNYDTRDAPDFNCPGPMELELGPDLDPPPVIPVTAGSQVKAPWEGALVHRDRMIELGSKLTLVRRLRWADRLQLRDEFAVVARHDQEVAEARRLFAEERAVSYRDQLERTRTDAEQALAAARSETGRAQAWYRSVWFGLILGFFSASALVALAAYVVTAI